MGIAAPRLSYGGVQPGFEHGAVAGGLRHNRIPNPERGFRGSGPSGIGSRATDPVSTLRACHSEFLFIFFHFWPASDHPQSHWNHWGRETILGTHVIGVIHRFLASFGHLWMIPRQIFREIFALYLLTVWHTLDWLVALGFKTVELPLSKCPPVSVTKKGICKRGIRRISMWYRVIFCVPYVTHNFLAHMP